MPRPDPLGQFLRSASYRIGKQTRTRGGCTIWKGWSWHGRRPMMQVTIDGKSYRKAVTHVAFFVRHRRWPNGALVKTCSSALCVNDLHWLEVDAKRPIAMANAKRRQLTEAQVREARKVYEHETMPLGRLAKAWGVSYKTVYNAARYWRYGFVE